VQVFSEVGMSTKFTANKSEVDDLYKSVTENQNKSKSIKIIDIK